MKSSLNLQNETLVPVLLQSPTTVINEFLNLKLYVKFYSRTSVNFYKDSRAGAMSSMMWILSQESYDRASMLWNLSCLTFYLDLVVFGIACDSRCIASSLTSLDVKNSLSRWYRWSYASTFNLRPHKSATSTALFTIVFNRLYFWTAFRGGDLVF